MVRSGGTAQQVYGEPALDLKSVRGSTVGGGPPQKGASAMSEGKFRFAYFTADYERTVAFYRDGVAFPVVEP
ncbi:hypothetical protein [Nocardia paucivorans]|uniref:hypothetical protein n=1 Tax=Nocardia paucivorans TaxID=114259 RepID=UPI0002F040DA|nr:hypothetical protein [Nocardia paucivorans]